MARLDGVSGTPRGDEARKALEKAHACWDALVGELAEGTRVQQVSAEDAGEVDEGGGGELADEGEADARRLEAFARRVEEEACDAQVLALREGATAVVMVGGAPQVLTLKQRVRRDAPDARVLFHDAARPAPQIAPWSLQRALLTPRVNPGSRYRCARST